MSFKFHRIHLRSSSGRITMDVLTGFALYDQALDSRLWSLPARSMTRSTLLRRRSHAGVITSDTSSLRSDAPFRLQRSTSPNCSLRPLLFSDKRRREGCRKTVRYTKFCRSGEPVKCGAGYLSRSISFNSKVAFIVLGLPSISCCNTRSETSRRYSPSFCPTTTSNRARI